MDLKRVSEMTEDEIRELAIAAEKCVCHALIEEVDSGDGYTFWAHVKRLRIRYDHAAIPAHAS